MANSIRFYRRMRALRIVVAILMFLLITASFMFFSHKFAVVSHLLHIQFVPAVLAASGVGLASLLILLLLTLLFGRVYCSWLCPLGIWMDVVSRITRWFRGDRKGVKLSKRPKYAYHKPHPILRWSILAGVLLLSFIGIMYPLIFLGPYSNWGRIVRTLFSPLIQLFTNLFSAVMPETLYYTDMAEFSVGIFISTLVFFLLVTIMGATRGRLYCNTICPVGSLLAAISKISFLKPAIAKDSCVACGMCSSRCKSECIDLETKQIDSSRCVMCFDCMTSCAKGVVTLAPRYRLFGKKEPYKSVEPESRNRRDALIALGTVGSLALVNYFRDLRPIEIHETKEEPGGIIPPGAVSLDHLFNNCTACHACVASCPSGVITYASGEYGIQGLFLPVIHYRKGFCSYDCHKCSDTCPTEALLPMTIEQKRLTQVGRVKFTAKHCIVFKDKTDCGACDEHCPTKAITMVEFPNRTDGLRYPSVNPDICIGCGACEYICPAEPVKAMKVHPLAVHKTALPPKVEKQDNMTVTDFGF